MKVLGQQYQGCGDEGDDADDVEAVHEGEQLGLGVELVVDAAVGCGRRRRLARSRGIADRRRSGGCSAAARGDGGGEFAADARLVEVLAALGHGGDEGDAEAAAPVAEEVGER